MTLQLIDLTIAIALMGFAAIDYASTSPECWPELLVGSEALAMLSGVMS